MHSPLSGVPLLPPLSHSNQSSIQFNFKRTMFAKLLCFLLLALVFFILGWTVCYHNLKSDTFPTVNRWINGIVTAALNFGRWLKGLVLRQ